MVKGSASKALRWSWSNATISKVTESKVNDTTSSLLNEHLKLELHCQH
jgi:hypothetical protein